MAKKKDTTGNSDSKIATADKSLASIEELLAECTGVNECEVARQCVERARKWLAQALKKPAKE